MPTATLSAKSQIVIPVAIQRRLGLRPGDRLLLEVEGERVVLRKAPESDLEALSRFRGAYWQGAAEATRDARDEWDR